MHEDLRGASHRARISNGSRQPTSQLRERLCYLGGCRPDLHRQPALLVGPELEEATDETTIEHILELARRGGARAEGAPGARVERAVVAQPAHHLGRQEAKPTEGRLAQRDDEADRTICCRPQNRLPPRAAGTSTAGAGAADSDALEARDRRPDMEARTREQDGPAAALFSLA